MPDTAGTQDHRKPDTDSKRQIEEIIAFDREEFFRYLSRLPMDQQRNLLKEITMAGASLEKKSTEGSKNLTESEKIRKKVIGNKIRLVRELFRERDFKGGNIPDGQKVIDTLKAYPSVVSAEERAAAIPDEREAELTTDLVDLRDVRTHIGELWTKLETSEYEPEKGKDRQKCPEALSFETTCEDLQDKKKERDRYLEKLKPIRVSLEKVREHIDQQINDLSLRKSKTDASSEIASLEGERKAIITLLNAVSFDQHNANKKGRKGNTVVSRPNAEPGNSGTDKGANGVEPPGPDEPVEERTATATLRPVSRLSDGSDMNANERADKMKGLTKRKLDNEISRLSILLSESQGGADSIRKDVQRMRMSVGEMKRTLESYRVSADAGDKSAAIHVVMLGTNIQNVEKRLRAKTKELKELDGLMGRITSLRNLRVEKFGPYSIVMDKKAEETFRSAALLRDEAEALRTSLQEKEEVVRRLDAGYEEASKAFQASLAKRGAELQKKLESIKQALLIFPSSGEIQAKVMQEMNITPDSLKEAHVELEAAKAERDKCRAELGDKEREIRDVLAASEPVDIVPADERPDPNDPEPTRSSSGDLAAAEKKGPDDLSAAVNVSTSVEFGNADVLDGNATPGSIVSTTDSTTDGVETPDSGAGSPLNKEPEKKVDDAGDLVDISEKVQRRFEAFGINRSDLIAVPGFSDLSEDQRLFVTEMLRQTAGRKIEDRARDAVATKSGLLKGFNLEKSRQAAADEILHGGMETYGKDLEQLVEGMKVSGLDMKEQDGAFDIRFLSMPGAFDENETLASEGESFNEAANRFSKIPHEWSLQGASKSERKAYDEAKQVFEASRERLEKALFSPDRSEDTRGYADLTKEYGAIRVAENRVRLIQHLTAHPEIGKHLDALQHRNLFLAGLKSVAAERSVYFAGGALGRAALLGAGTASFVAAPVVAMISGGFMGRHRAKETLIELDRQARRGKDIVTKPVPGDGAGWFKKLIGKPESISQEKLKTGKRLMVHASVPKNESGGDEGKRGLAERLDIINKRIAKLAPDDDISMNRELGMLAARVEYVKKKLDSDQVNFGDGTEGIRSRIVLMEALSRAEMNLGIFTGGEDAGSVSSRFNERFGQAQKNEEVRVKDARGAYVRYETKKGAVMAGTISLLGAGVMSAAHEASAALQHLPNAGPVNEQDAVDGVTGLDTPSVGTSASGKKEIVQRIVETDTPGAGPVVENVVAEAAAKPSGVAAEALKQTVPESVANKGMKKAAGTIGKTYVEAANRGEGVTHLARRALAEYVGKDPKLSDLTAEQKVYIEDYLQKKLGHAGSLQSGEKLVFTKEMMDEAVGKARGLSVAEQDNLRHYVRQVEEFRSSARPVSEEMPMRAAPKAEDVVWESSETSARPESGAVAPAEAEGEAPKPTELQPVSDSVPSGSGEVVREAAGADTVSMGTDRVMKTVTSDVAREYLNDPSHMEPFRTARDVTIRGLFPSETGGIDRESFLKIGKMASRNVFRDCLLSIGDPKRSVSGSGFGEERLRHIGKFMLAMNDRGIVPFTALGKEERFLAYIERASVFVAEHSDETPQSMVSSISDARLDALAKAAIGMGN